MNINTGQSFVEKREIEWINECNERFKSFNWTQSGATYTELERYLRRSVSGRRASDLINTALEQGIIYKSDKKKYYYRGFKELPNDEAQDLPFDNPTDDDEVPF